MFEDNNAETWINKGVAVAKQIVSGKAFAVAS